MSDSENQENKPKKRSLTSVTLGWIAERIRKAERIKQELESGSYNVPSEKIAASIINKD